MMENRSRCVAERVVEPVRQPGIEDQLEECMDILEELEETLDSFRWLRDELQFAMDDISDELEDIQLRQFSDKCAELIDVILEDQ